MKAVASAYATVIPAQAGIQEMVTRLHLLDARLRGNDGGGCGPGGDAP